MSLSVIFRQHIALRQKSTEQALRECRFDALVIGAGELQYYVEDDAAVNHRTYHHFNHWCPLIGENHLLVIRPGQRPELCAYIPDDYWHEHADLEDAFWLAEFNVISFGNVEALWQHVAKVRDGVYIGPDKVRAEAAGLKTDAATLLPRLNWERSFKSEYEVKCVERATRRAATGHVAAREAFFAGGSELDIHHAYMRAIRQIDRQLPYETIVCLNEKAAVLHYHKKRDKTRLGKTFLLDAGVRYKGYACDITRSYAADAAPAEFRSLLGGMNKLQQNLCGLIKPGLSFEHLHAQAHLDIAALLLDHGVLRNLSKEQAVERGLSQVFFPHGLGHMLGIHVHDVAGKQVDRTGTLPTPQGKHKTLRTSRILDAGNLLTVEPGLYFIDMLLKPQRGGEHAACFNWALIDTLMPCGGIRVEDNVLVTRSGQRNITRAFLP